MVFSVVADTTTNTPSGNIKTPEKDGLYSREKNPPLFFLLADKMVRVLFSYISK